MNDTVSGRALAAALGVNEKAVRKAVLAGRIKRQDDGKFDLATCRTAWGRSTDPARSRVRTADQAPGPQSAPAKARNPQLPRRPVTTLVPSDAASLWAVVDYLAALVPWAVAGHGGRLQLAFAVHADLLLDLSAEMNRRGFALPGTLEVVDWHGLAEEFGLDPVDSAALAAEWKRRREAAD